MCWELVLQTVHQLGTSFDKCGSNKPFYSIITYFRSRNTPTTMLTLIYVLSRCYSTTIHHFWLCGSIMLCITISHDHYLDVIMSAMTSHITGVSIDCLLNHLFRRRSKKISPRHWPLWGESTVDQCIPLTKGQKRGKCFHLMTLSWYLHVKKTCIPFKLFSWE